jgi:SAM-dependent methyltransferase
MALAPWRHKMESVLPCLICNTNIFELIFKKNGFNIGKCSHCATTQVIDPPPSAEIDGYYDQDFFHKFYDKLLNDPKRQAYEYRKFNFRLEEIEKEASRKGSILDVGCSFGFFLDAARKRGWKTYGVEIGEYAANYAKSNFNLTVFTEPLNDVDFEDEFFDVVTLWNVIEHLDDPNEMIQDISRILKIGGILVLTTANIESPLARLKKENWRVLIPPIHLSYFSPSTIEYLLNSANLEVIQQTAALPYEFMLKKTGLLGLARKLKVSDKMLVYAKKTI